MEGVSEVRREGDREGRVGGRRGEWEGGGGELGAHPAHQEPEAVWYPHPLPSAQ